MGISKTLPLTLQSTKTKRSNSPFTSGFNMTDLNPLSNGAITFESTFISVQSQEERTPFINKGSLPLLMIQILSL